MTDEEEREWLKNLPKDWWQNHNTTVMVADTLNRYGYFTSKDHVITFFREPRNSQRVIDELIKELSE